MGEEGKSDVGNFYFIFGFCFIFIFILLLLIIFLGLVRFGFWICVSFRLGILG